MRIFGLNITRQSTDDIKEATSFRTTVRMIKSTCISLTRMITTDLNIEEIEFAHELGLKLQKLIGYVDLYMNNKFSSPSVAFNIENTMCTLKMSIADIIDVISQNYIMTNTNVENDDDEIINMHKQLFARLLESVQKAEISLMSLQFVIEYDRTKCVTNIDIIKDYKRRQRTKLSNHDTLYFVKFAKINKEKIINKGAK